jgi:hypothetical protein
MTITAADLDTALDAIVNRFSQLLYRGGGNTVTTQAGVSGTIYDPADMDGDRGQLLLKADVGGGVATQRILATKHGHVARPHELFDDFMYLGDTGNVFPATDPAIPWRVQYTGSPPNAPALMTNVQGGAITLESGVLDGDYATLISGKNTTLAQKWWNIGAAPWGVFMVRFRIPTITEVIVRLGFWADDPIDHGATSRCIAELDTDVVAGKMKLRTRGSSESSGTNLNGGSDLVAGTWYTLRVAINSTSQALGQINSEDPVTDTVGGGTFTNGGYCFGAYVQTLVDPGGAAGDARTLDIDQVYVADGQIRDDMILNEA